jgi:hypothetical protein
MMGKNVNGIGANLGGSVGSLVSQVVDLLSRLLGGVTGQGNGAQVNVGNLASVSLNAPSGNGNLASVTASTSPAATGESLSASVEGLVGTLVGGVVNDLSLLLGGVSGQGTGFSLSIGLASVAINQQPTPASLLSLGVSAGGMGATGGGV